MIMEQPSSSDTAKEISCRVTRTLLMYVRENNGGSLGNLLDGLALDETYLSDPNQWVSHALLQELYRRMLDLLGDDNAVYKMTLGVQRSPRSLGILDRIVRLMGSPKLIYAQATKYNRLLKRNGRVIYHDIGEDWVLLEDRYHDSAQTEPLRLRLHPGDHRRHSHPVRSAGSRGRGDRMPVVTARIRHPHLAGPPAPALHALFIPRFLSPLFQAVLVVTSFQTLSVLP